MTVKRTNLGRLGEKIALLFLKDVGYSILEHNYRTRLGEIDIIAEDSGTLVFVEVKTRVGATFGHPYDAVTPKKQMQMSKVALGYIVENDGHKMDARFDVVGISFDKGCNPSARNAKVEILKNAFDLSYGLK